MDTTHDLCLKLENGYVFRVHKAFVAERCDYFRTFLHDPFNETKQHIIYDSMSKTNSKHVHKVSELLLRQISPEVFTEVIFFLYSNDFSRPKVNLKEYIDYFYSFNYRINYSNLISWTSKLNINIHTPFLKSYLSDLD